MHFLLPTHFFFGLVLLSIRYLSSDETVVQLDGMVLLDRDTVAVRDGKERARRGHGGITGRETAG